MRRRYPGPADPDEAAAAAQHCPERRVVRSQIDSSMLAAERVGVTRTSVEGLCSWRGRATPRSGGDPRGGHRFVGPFPPSGPLRSSGSYGKRGLARPPFPSKRPAPRACIHRPRLRGENVDRAMFTIKTRCLQCTRTGYAPWDTGRAPTCPRRRCPAVADRQPPAGVRPLSGYRGHHARPRIVRSLQPGLTAISPLRTQSPAVRTDPGRSGEGSGWPRRWRRGQPMCVTPTSEDCRARCRLRLACP